MLWVLWIQCISRKNVTTNKKLYNKRWNHISNSRKLPKIKLTGLLRFQGTSLHFLLENRGSSVFICSVVCTCFMNYMQLKTLRHDWTVAEHGFIDNLLWNLSCINVKKLKKANFWNLNIENFPHYCFSDELNNFFFGISNHTRKLLKFVRGFSSKELTMSYFCFKLWIIKRFQIHDFYIKYTSLVMFTWSLEDQR